MAGDRQWQEQEAGREGYNKNPGICKENPKNPDRMRQFLTNVKIPRRHKDFSLFPCKNKIKVVPLYQKKKR